MSLTCHQPTLLSPILHSLSLFRHQQLVGTNSDIRIIFRRVSKSELPWQRLGSTARDSFEFVLVAEFFSLMASLSFGRNDPLPSWDTQRTDSTWGRTNVAEVYFSWTGFAAFFCCGRTGRRTILLWSFARRLASSLWWLDISNPSARNYADIS